MMIPKIRLISIATDDVARLVKFYKDVMGFTGDDDDGDYVELEHDGVRFAICARSLMYKLSNHDSYKERAPGQRFELAFWLPNKDDVDTTFDEIVKKGATSILAPHDMPWGQRTALFADLDGNIHEIYAD